MEDKTMTKQDNFSKNTDRAVFVAFPGIGKTTYARSHTNVVDLDYGYYDKAFKAAYSGRDQKKGPINFIFTRMISSYLKDGWVVLTNHPYIIKNLVGEKMKVIMVLPSDPDDLVKRVENRDGQKNKFVIDLKQNIHKWINDWERIAKEYNVDIAYVNYFGQVFFDDFTDDVLSKLKNDLFWRLNSVNYKNLEPLDDEKFDELCHKLDYDKLIQLILSVAIDF